MSPTSSPPPHADEIPAYYQGAECPHCAGVITPADISENCDNNLGNVIKYAYRAGKKPGEPALKDLGKCLDYLNRAIRREKRMEARRGRTEGG